MEFSDLKAMFGEVKARMDVSIDRVRKEMANVRTGRANVGMLDNVQVEAYGAKMPLNQVAALSIPEPALIAFSIALVSDGSNGCAAIIAGSGIERAAT